MRRKYHRGFLAEKYLNATGDKKQVSDLSKTYFIEHLDYFEKQKRDMISKFNDDETDYDNFKIQREELS